MISTGIVKKEYDFTKNLHDEDSIFYRLVYKINLFHKCIRDYEVKTEGISRREKEIENEWFPERHLYAKINYAML